MSSQNDLLMAEEHIRHGKYADGIELLEPLAANNATARQMLLHALSEEPNPEIAIRCFCNPSSPAEIIQVLSAFDELDDISSLKAMLATPAIQDCDDPSVKQIRSKLNARVSR